MAKIGRRWILLALATVLGALVVLVPPMSASAVDARSDSALGVVQTLAVKGRAPLTGYDRASFGSPWRDVDGNGCDTRNDILRRDLLRTDIASNGCDVLSGTLFDPYTGKRIPHVAGRSAIDIDHVVSLGNAWQTGAFRWSTNRRVAFANDPLNLLAVDASANRQKSDGDAATWLPSNKGYRCEFIARQVAVKSKYQLWITTAERDAMVRILNTCPSMAAPRG